MIGGLLSLKCLLAGTRSVAAGSMKYGSHSNSLDDANQECASLTPYRLRKVLLTCAYWRPRRELLNVASVHNESRNVGLSAKNLCKHARLENPPAQCF